MRSPAGRKAIVLAGSGVLVLIAAFLVVPSQNGTVEQPVLGDQSATAVPFAGKMDSNVGDSFLQRGITEYATAKPEHRGEVLDSIAELALLDQWIETGRGEPSTLQKIVEDSRKPTVERVRAARALASIGSHEALQALFDAIWAETDTVMQQSLVSALDTFGDIETIDSLVSLLESPEEPEIHAAVIDAISRLAQESTVEYLAELANNATGGSGALAPAVRALSAIRNEESVPALASILSREDASPLVRQAAATSLARMGTKESLLHLAGAGANSSEPNTHGIQALASIQDPAAVSSLKSLLGVSENLEVAQAISTSLQMIESVHAPVP
jgi:hypothetical protein